MIRSILLPALAGSCSEAALATACDLARDHDAHVVAVNCISAVVPVTAWGTYPLAVCETLSEAAAAAGSRLVLELTAKLEQADVSYEVHTADTIWMTPSEMAAVHARYCDIIVFGRQANVDARMQAGFFSDLLLQSGRPLLMVPEASHARLTDAAMVAWKPTREGTRALHDALPLLRKAASVRVVAVDPKVGDLQHGELPGADIAAHLVRHGLRVEVAQVPRLGASTGAAILREAQEQGIALLVAGGYGHTRAREWVMGGVTRTLFEDAPLPVLFSH
jgi:nucleotide-binding universal stress UspA family protein